MPRTPLNPNKMSLKQLILETNAYTNGIDKRRRTPPTDWYRARGWIRTHFWQERIEAQGPMFNGMFGKPNTPTLYQEMVFDKWLAEQPDDIRALVVLKGGWEWAQNNYETCMAGL